MGIFCPYIDGETVYLQCQECKKKICENHWFYCLIVGRVNWNKDGDNAERVKTRKLYKLIAKHKYRGSIYFTDDKNANNDFSEHYKLSQELKVPLKICNIDKKK